MKRIILTLVMCFSFSWLFGQTNNFRTVSADEFEEFITDTNVVVLDVRTEAEHAEGFIPGTHYNIDVLEETFNKVATETLPKDKPIAYIVVVATEARVPHASSPRTAIR